MKTLLALLLLIPSLCFSNNINYKDWIIKKPNLLFIDKDQFTEKINNNPNFIVEEASTPVLEGLKRAEKMESNRPLIPALIAQIYIRRYEDGTKDKIYLSKSVRFIKNRFGKKSPKILYGGSVNSNNINKLKDIDNLNGFLIGGSSQNSKIFIDIIKKTFN